MSLMDIYINRIKELPEDQTEAFCDEIRAFLLKNISSSGGHLASNLGAVELTVALHRVFDSSYDRIIFDVGHQCYVHKLLTGRRDGFSGFRALGAMSGFPKPAESEHDAFATGHASTSISAALGMARARTLLNQHYSTVAVIGDGALTGGMAYEALNDAGQSKEPLIVILNDNGMSITRNVGGVARHLASLRLKPQYFHAKRMYHKLVDPMPGGRAIDRFLRKGKQMVKDAMIPGSMFQHMGFDYLGPIDGHDVERITVLLQQALERKKPVLIHLITKKGKGYAHSESNPSAFHGVGGFHVGSGKATVRESPSFAAVFGETLVALGEKDNRICAITAAMRDGTGLGGFARRFPRRFYDVGIAEEHAVTMAAAMAKQGMRPVVAIYSTFLQRAYDQIVHDTALQNIPVVFAVDRAGLVGEDGETHHGVLDPLFLSSVPGMNIWAPANFAELREMLEKAFQLNEPVAIRYPRGGEGAYQTIATGDVSVVRMGRDATIVTYGMMTNEAIYTAELLQKYGISVCVIKISSLKPFPLEEVIGCCRGEVFLLEDNVGLLPLQMKGIPVNTGDRFIPHGSVAELRSWCGIDATSLTNLILERFGIPKDRAT